MRKKTSPNNPKTSTLAATKSGFTMIEFSIATAFIAVLLISIAIVTSNIITTYQKGLTLKAVNSVGRGLIDEFTTSINAAPAVDTTSLCRSHVGSAAQQACLDDRANNFIFQHRLGTRQAPGEPASDNTQLGGIFCTGKYSYVWNTYYAYEANQEKGSPMISLKYSYMNGNNANTATLTDFRLARIEDPTYRVCTAMVDNDYTTKWSKDSGQTEIDITQLANGNVNITKEPEQGFLNSFDLDLQLYELTMFPISQDDFTLRTFMSGTFILATERGNINITRSSDYCDIEHLAQDEETSTALLNIGSEFNYCAINKFNFAARTAGM